VAGLAGEFGAKTANPLFFVDGFLLVVLGGCVGGGGGGGGCWRRSDYPSC